MPENPEINPEKGARLIGYCLLSSFFQGKRD
jgi:hypothetical protein